MRWQDEIIGAVESSANRSVFRTISTTQVNRSASTEECVDILKAVLVQFLSDVDQKLSLNLFSMFKNKEESFRALVAEKTGLDKIPMKITPVEAATAKNIYDEDVSNEKVLDVEFYVVDPLMPVQMGITTNTDIDVNQSHQQVSMAVTYNDLRITRPEEELYTVVMQNWNEQTARVNLRPSFIHQRGLQWEHQRELIFDAGNEYHKFEVLDVSHSTMGIERIIWDGERYQAYPFASTIRRNYLTDVSANGAFLIRNSDRSEINNTCEYVWVNYTLEVPYCGDIFLQGQWTNSADHTAYQMQYDGEGQCYRTQVMQKQGYYSFQYVTKEGKTAPTEGNFYQTRNTYQALVYYKGLGDRTWQLVGYHVSPQVPKRY